MGGLGAVVQPVGVYPERRPDADGRHELRIGARLSDRLRPVPRALRGETAAFLKAVARIGPTACPAPVELARALRRGETRWTGTIACFALVRQAVERHFGFRPHDEQLAGAWHMLTGKLVEMETGEGKTVTAVFTAAAHALAGRSVHVVTVNDYLAERDAQDMGPVYAALGLSVGCVTGGMEEDARRQAYEAPVVYVTPKQLMFDYLRDRLSLGSRAGSQLRTDIAVLRDRPGGAGGGGFYLRGLQAAIVDEADSVLIDEAVVPLIISRQDVSPDQGRIAADSIAVARNLQEGRDFGMAVARRDLWLTEAGRSRLADLARPLGGVLAGKLWREQYAEQALTALHLFRRDRDYIIRDGAVEIIDIATGRTMPDRSWERGLHQMIQAKEDLLITAPNESVTRITHQAFFQRYLNLCGMSGTVREVSGEIRRVYGLRTIRVPRHHPARRYAAGVTVLARGGGKAALVAERAAKTVAAGRSVLIGTRTITDSEAMSAGLARAGLPHRVLNAHRDTEEAAIIAAAGQSGAVTVATNMAGRGTDIKLDATVRRAGGLHVIATERHESRRIDRQLFGRSARQDDPGSYEEIVALDDEVMARHCPALLLALARWPLGLKRFALAVGQRRASRRGRELRLRFAHYETGMDQALGFAGREGREA